MSPEDAQLNRKLRERFASMKQHFATPEQLVGAFERSRDAILREIRQVFPEAKLHNIGPDKTQRSDFWECLIQVDTDQSRDLLQNDELLMQRLKRAGEGAGFPPYLIEIESDETVRRRFGGNWFNRMR